MTNTVFGSTNFGSCSWHEVYNSNEVNTAYNNFASKYIALVNTHLPQKTVRFKKTKTFHSTLDDKWSPEIYENKGKIVHFNS